MLHPPIRPFSVKNTANANDRAILSRVQLNEVINIGKFQDLTGQRFGKLEVIERVENKNGRVMWLCKCDCGNYHTTTTNSLKSGLCVSCGCLNPFKNPLVNPAKCKFNTYDLSGEYGIGYTSKGEEFYFDLEDYDKIKDYCWYINNNGYVVSNKKISSKKQRKIFMHRIIMNVEDSFVQVDHIYHNRIDNRKSKLRVVTNQQNQMNQQLHINNTSGITGVYWYKNKWESLISFNGKLQYLGLFDNFDDAVKARKEAEIRCFGDYRYQGNINSVLKDI